MSCVGRLFTMGSDWICTYVSTYIIEASYAMGEHWGTRAPPMRPAYYYKSTCFLSSMESKNLIHKNKRNKRVLEYMLIVISILIYLLILK